MRGLHNYTPKYKGGKPIPNSQFIITFSWPPNCSLLTDGPPWSLNQHKKMREMAYEVRDFQSSEESKKLKEGSFGSNNSCEPISVLDKRRSPSPSTSTSTLSSSLGGAVNAATTAALALTYQHKWPDSVPHEMGMSGCDPNFAAEPGRKDEWPELQPIPAEFHLHQQGFGVGLDAWESLLSESTDSPAQDQSLLRWISGEVDDPSLSFQQLLQANQLDQNAPPTTAVFQTPPPPNSNFCPSNQKPPIFNPPQPPLPTQFHHETVQKPPNLHQELQKVPVFTQDHEILVKKQNQQLSLHQQQSMMMAVAKQEPPDHHQHQLICDHLFAAAELTLSRNFPNAQAILARLNHHLPSPNSPFSRASFYFKEALFTKLGPNLMTQRVCPTTFNGIYKMGAYKMLSEVSPVIQFMNFTSNQILLESIGDAKNIHIIDFDIGFGAQWASFIQELNNNGGCCSLKITAFASPSTHHPIELGIMHENLSQFAHEIGVSFELEVVNFDSFDPRSFSVNPKAAIAVNFPIWSASTHLSAIPSILHFIKQLGPRIVVSLDRGCERTDLPLPHYILQGVQYYELLFNSIDGANVPSDVSSKIEKLLFLPQIESMVLGKLQSPEPMPHWRTLFTAGAYSPVVLSNMAQTQADCLVNRAQVRGFHVEKRQAALVLCWQNRELVTASAWKC